MTTRRPVHFSRVISTSGAHACGRYSPHAPHVPLGTGGPAITPPQAPARPAGPTGPHAPGLLVQVDRFRVSVARGGWPAAALGLAIMGVPRSEVLPGASRGKLAPGGFRLGHRLVLRTAARRSGWAAMRNLSRLRFDLPAAGRSTDDRLRLVDNCRRSSIRACAWSPSMDGWRYRSRCPSNSGLAGSRCGGSGSWSGSGGSGIPSWARSAGVSRSYPGHSRREAGLPRLPGRAEPAPECVRLAALFLVVDHGSARLRLHAFGL